MFQNDYILRLIQRLGVFLRRIKEITDEHEQERLLQEFCQEHCGITMKLLTDLQEESLEEMLPTEARIAAAELLYIKSGLSSWEKTEYQLKCLRLMTSLAEEGPYCEARASRLSEMEISLQQDLTARDFLRCAEFLMEGNSFAEGEDAVFRAADAACADELPEFLERGERLLFQAAEADETDLARCNTSSQEMYEAAETFRDQFGHSFDL